MVKPKSTKVKAPKVTKTKAAKVKVSFPEKKMEELRTISKNAPAHVIVQGDGYLYFSIQPTQEDITIAPVATEKHVICLAVKNFKGTVIGYVVQLKRKPKILNIQEFGASIFYTQAKTYKKSKMLYADQKFRAISFDSKDYFMSVKWKSNNPSE